MEIYVSMYITCVEMYVAHDMFNTCLWLDFYFEGWLIDSIFV